MSNLHFGSKSSTSNSRLGISKMRVAKSTTIVDQVTIKLQVHVISGNSSDITSSVSSNISSDDVDGRLRCSSTTDSGPGVGCHSSSQGLSVVFPCKSLRISYRYINSEDRVVRGSVQLQIVNTGAIDANQPYKIFDCDLNL